MKIALLPSTQWRNAVLGGGTEALYAHDICERLKNYLASRITCLIFSAAKNEKEWASNRDANIQGAAMAVRWGANLCISIHSDGGYRKASHHASLICYQEERTRPIAEAILNGFCRRIGHTPRGVEKRYPGINGVAVLRIPEASGIPAVLLEITWHDRNPDAALLRDPAWRERAARALGDTLLEIYGEKQDKTEEKKEGEIEMPRFELLRTYRENNQEWRVYACARVHHDYRIDIHAEAPGHHHKTYWYRIPIGPAPANQVEEVYVGGWDNKDNRGTSRYLREIFGNCGEFRMVIHSPVPLAIELSQR